MQNISQENERQLKPLKSKRLIELDSLRGLACLSVMLFHYAYYYGETWGHLNKPLILFQFGRYGLELFFLISGFVIFNSLKHKQVQKFIILRFWRLFPTYWVAIIFIFLISRLFPLSPEVIVHGKISIGEFIGNFTMIPTVFSLRYVDRTHWSLCFELFFYLHLTIIFVLCKGKQERVFYVLLFWTTLSIIWHKTIELSGIRAWDTIWWREDMGHWQYVVAKLFLLPYIHLFFMGISFYFIYNKQKIKTAIFSLIFCLATDYLIWGYIHTIPVIIDVIILYIALFIKPSLLRNAILIYVGTISYSLYIVHQNIGFRVIQHLENLGFNSNLAILMAIIVAFAIANPLHFYIEKPSYQWIKEKLNQRQLAINNRS
jgi:peptidoglycan/LPS O-acetylase OafA/YrhL